MEEKWKPIPGYPDGYEVNKKGQVRTYYHGEWHIMSPGKDRNGYVLYSLGGRRHKKTLYAHRGVALAFIPNPQNLPQVNHKDGNKKNNCIENLEWCDRSYNVNHSRDILKNNPGYCANKAVKCVETGEAFKSIREAACKMKTDESTIGRVANHIKYCHTAGGYHWEFVERT